MWTASLLGLVERKKEHTRRFRACMRGEVGNAPPRAGKNSRSDFSTPSRHTQIDPPPEVTSIKPESWFPNPPCRDWLLFRSRPGVSSLSKCPASRDLPPKRAPLPSHRLSRNLEVTFRDYWLPDGIRSLEDILSLATGSKDLRSLTRSRTVLPISYGYYGD